MTAAMIAVIPVRDGVPPVGYDEAVSEAAGSTIVIGTGAALAATVLAPFATEVRVVESNLDPAHLARIVSGIVGSETSLLLPACPDGRDLAPHLAHRLGRPLYAGAVLVSSARVSVSVRGGLGLVDHAPTGPFVATLQIGVRGSEPSGVVARVETITDDDVRHTNGSVHSIVVTPPDVSTMDLAEAPRIVGGGAGLSDGSRFTLLAEIAAAIGASMGVTRVITDRGWVGHERQIGTTGVVVDPRLYLSFGVSGAVQHTSGLGQPDHIVSVNTDAHCPMMQMSDLAIVSDANAVLDELASLLSTKQESVA
ncbi:MAG: mycofactocin-associated electron transfer flavoprotein alpha subunit [Acidimicrobiia bacterium]